MHIPKFIIELADNGVFVEVDYHFWAGSVNASEIIKMFPMWEQSRKSVGTARLIKRIVTPYTGNLMSMAKSWEHHQRFLINTQYGQLLPEDNFKIFKDLVDVFQKDIRVNLSQVIDHLDEIRVIIYELSEKWAEKIWTECDNEGSIPITLVEKIYEVLKNNYGTAGEIRKRSHLKVNYHPTKFNIRKKNILFDCEVRDENLYKEVFSSVLNERKKIVDFFKEFNESEPSTSYNIRLKNTSFFAKYSANGLPYEDKMLVDYLNDIHMKILISDVGKFEKYQRAKKVSREMIEYVESKKWETDCGIF